MANSKNLITGKRNNKAQDKAPAKPEAPETVEAQGMDEDEEMAKLKLELALAKQELAKEQNKNKRASATKGTAIKISQKGCVSVYGLMRFPVSLYKSQWIKLFALVPELQEFIEQNKDVLPDKKVAAPKK